VSLLWCDLGIARFSLTLFSVLSGTPLMLHICLGTSEAFSSILCGTFVMHDVFSGTPFLLCFVKLLKGDVLVVAFLLAPSCFLHGFV
jgi:hypothetical protein